MSKISLKLVGDETVDAWASKLAAKYESIGSPESHTDMSALCTGIEQYRRLIGDLPFKGGPCDKCPKRDADED